MLSIASAPAAPQERSMTESTSRPVRTIVQADAFEWMAANAADPAASVITSLPDVSELPLDFDAWRSWFIDAARRVIRWTPPSGVAIFYQSDIRHRGEWVDKGYLVMRAAEEEQAPVLWHKIVCRHPPGTISLGRPTYSHMICVMRGPRAAMRRPGPDVLPEAGFAPWSRAMGVAACRVACRFLCEETASRIVVDPFCGRGTVLAVANTMGLDAIGIDLSAKRCRAARSLSIDVDGSM
jgi:DNA methylase